MGSNLNIKYGQKTGTGNTLKSQNNPGVTPGNIYAAENTTGNIEMYIDTPKTSGSARKRLDPRIFVGDLSDVPNLLSDQNATQAEIDLAKTNAIWDNYDVWIDTSGDPTGVATATTNGLMSSTNVNDINDLKDDIATVKTKINGLIGALQGLNIAIKRGPWNNSMGANNTLTIVMPNDWAGTEVTFNPDGNVTQFTTTGGSDS